MDEYASDQGREATAVREALPAIDGAESLLNELSSAFVDSDPPTPPEPPSDVQAVIPEEIPVSSPPRIEPPAMIWKPSRRACFRLRRR
jgi:hypothetical protein